MNIKVELKKQGFTAIFETRRFIVEKFLDSDGNINDELDGPFKVESIRDYGEQDKIYPYGGQVKIKIINDKTGERSVGVSVCSIEDNFCKKDGIALAFKRAVENLIDKPDMTPFTDTLAEFDKKHSKAE